MISRIISYFKPKITLEDQVERYCNNISWPKDAIATAKKTAIDICGSNSPCTTSDLEEVMREVCRVEE